jgi:CPA2 family monovalent cation:H+ antiporter-2
VHNLDLILTLAAGLIAAFTFGFFTHRLGWSPIVGYLLAGVLVGPYTPGFVADTRLAEQLAEVGVILLMFGVGLHFHLKDLLAVRRVAIAGAVCQSAIATVLGAVAARAMGWNWPAGVVYGLALSVASTVVLTRVLADNDELQSPTGRIAVGWLVVEDIFTVFVLVLLPVVFADSAADAGRSLPEAFAIAGFKLAVFVIFTLVAGARFIPWLLNRVANTHSRELFTLSILAITLGIAVGSTVFFDVSMALGAFLAGMVVGQSDFSARAGAEALPMRDAFAVMFFLSVGMLLNPQAVIGAPLMSLATLGIVMIGKPVAALALVALFGYSSRIGLGVAIALAQIGEFSFLLAVLGRDLGVLPTDALNALVSVAIVSIMLNPLLYPQLDRIERALAQYPRIWRLLNRQSGDSQGAIPLDRDGGMHYAIVVGYGPIGRTVARLLKERGIQPTIIEMNIETFRRLKAARERAVYGDASQKEVLEAAGVAHTTSLILTASGSAGSAEAIRQARRINPRIHVVVRADFLGQTQTLLKAGADEVFSGEGEVVMAVTESILRRLGATPEQLEEESDRIRRDLFVSQQSAAPDARP